MDVYWRQVGSQLVPEPVARAPWGENMLHGRLLSALAARAVEREHGDPDFHCARLTVDLFRAARLEPVEVRTESVRQGGRVRAVDVEIESQGKVVARAAAVLLRHGEQPKSRAWAAPEWDAPPPAELAVDESPEARFLPIDTRPITPGGFRAAGRKRIWLRELCGLVEGEEWTPLTRAAAVADLANAVASTGEEPNMFINADVALYLGRLPAGEWIGLEATGHVGAEGVSVGSCDLYDEGGRIGWSTFAAVANPIPVDVGG
jgi:acyl-coenzyme A thioesterase PaaI-like protein